ncbi:MAG: MFS transporter [Gammaproteobacteria bacterium]|nr:MFS transporter [Gammaproteobacteria bacterium]
MNKEQMQSNRKIVRWLTYIMFMMFAMTSDAVGVNIPEIIKEFSLSLTQASAFHYTTMIAIALSGVLFGFLADKIGRKRTIVIGLFLFGISCFLFAAGNNFTFFLALLALSGAAIGIFKTGALALIGDISTSTSEHTGTMNTVEGFFAVGAIIGPAIVSALLVYGLHWKYLYMIAGAMCVALLLFALTVKYPETKAATSEHAGLARTLKMMANPYALGFSMAIALYVATEVAIYVWMPTFLQDYSGSLLWLSTYALTIFFVFRALGRFMGAWILQRYNWTSVMLVFSLAIFLCFLGSMIFGTTAAVLLLPLSGLFMSMIYPTINSKGISCFEKSEHGTVAGVILFFTAVAAAVGPLIMGFVGDVFGNVKFGFYVATGFAGLLFLGMLYNFIKNPAEAIHATQDKAVYSV